MALTTNPTLAAPAPRNPYAGRGLVATLRLLLEPEREWSVRELADAADASPALVSRVLARLRADRLVIGDVSQGRRASVRATRELFWSTADHWPPPDGFVQGPLPERAPIGGAPAYRALGITTEARTRVYVRSRDEAFRVLALTGGTLVPDPVADYEIVVLDLDLAPGAVPSIVAALELAATPRGREIVRSHPELLAELRPAPRRRRR